MTQQQVRPKIGLALSGGSGRAIAHIGVLEVLCENNIPLDFITAASSGTLIAASYACGTMEELKRDWLHMNKRFLLNLLELQKSGGGALNLDKGKEWFEKYTLHKNFEDVKPVLGFVCADIISGTPVVLSLGDISRAAQAGCTVPGLMEPVEWGNKLLVDSGLFTIIPTVQAKELGADIVIGVDIASTRYMFSKKFHQMRKGYNFIKNLLPVRIYAKLHGWIDYFFTKSIDFIYYNQSDILENTDFMRPGMFSIFGKALDISIAQKEKYRGIIHDVDCLISPDVKHIGIADFQSAVMMIAEGRKAALAALPEINRLIQDFDWRKKSGLPGIKLRRGVTLDV